MFRRLARLAAILLIGAAPLWANPTETRADALSDFAASVPAPVLQSAALFIEGAPGTRFLLLRLADQDRLFHQELSADGTITLNTEVTEIRETGRRLVNLSGEVDSSGLIAFIEMQTADGFGETFEFYLNGTEYVFQPASN